MSSDGNPHVKAVGKLLQQQFGFKECVIIFESSGVVNACTLPMDFVGRIRRNEVYKYDKKNGYYDTTHTMCVFATVYDGLLATDGITGGMLLAVILHEIGHNLDNSPWMLASDITGYIKGAIEVSEKIVDETSNNKAISIGINVLINSIMRNTHIEGVIANIFNNLIRKIPPLEAMLKIFSFGKSEYKQIKRLFNKIQTVAMVTSGQAFMRVHAITVKAFVDLLYNLSGAPLEIHADEMAALYGYGAEAAKMFTLMEYNKLKVPGQISAANSPIINFLYDYYTSTFDLLLGLSNPHLLVDPHPSNQSRIKNVIRKYERDLANADFPPQMKKELEKELEDTKRLYESYINCTRDEERGKIFTLFFRKANETLFGGRDIHNFIPMKHL